MDQLYVGFQSIITCWTVVLTAFPCHLEPCCRCLVTPCTVSTSPQGVPSPTSGGGGGGGASVLSSTPAAMDFDQPTWVPRLQVCFSGEDPSVYMQR